MDRLRSDRINVPLQFEDARQLDPGKVLEHFQHGILIDHALCNLVVAIIARFQDQAERFDLAPEGFVIHRFQPFFNIINKMKHAHDQILGNLTHPMQIYRAKRGLV